jgi:hypothetical protein
MGRKPGIKFAIGSRNIQDSENAFEDWLGPAKVVQKKWRDLSLPFRQISDVLIARIQNRIKDNTFGEPPFEPLGGLAKAVRGARGYNADSPALISSGVLLNSIRRAASPTTTPSGAKRNMLTLRIGSFGAPHAEFQMEGGTWFVPVVEVESSGRKGGGSPDSQNKKKTYIDYDRIYGSAISSQEAYGDKWAQIQASGNFTEKAVEVTGREFLSLFPEDEEFILTVFSQYALDIELGDIPINDDFF